MGVIPNRGYRKYKGREAGVCLAYSGNSKKPLQLQWNEQRREARSGVRENGVGKEERSCRSSLALYGKDLDFT